MLFRFTPYQSTNAAHILPSSSLSLSLPDRLRNLLSRASAIHRCDARKDFYLLSAMTLLNVVFQLIRTSKVGFKSHPPHHRKCLDTFFCGWTCVSLFLNQPGRREIVV